MNIQILDHLSNLYFYLFIHFLTVLSGVFQEIYSIKLPGDPKLGEGKPENQNHAIIFTRGNAVQTIDMNQVANSFFIYLQYKNGLLMLCSM